MPVGPKVIPPAKQNVKPTTTPKARTGAATQTIKKSFLDGQSVNLYKDPQNTQFLFKAKIKNVQEVGKRGVIQLNSDNGTFKFYCDLPQLLVDRNGKLSQVYNKEFENDIRGEYCAINPSGVSVPRADYVSAGTPKPTGMAEGKKVIRLTEKDLGRLVNRVLNEQGVAPQVNYKVDPSWLRPNGWRVVKEDGKVVLPNLIVNGVVGCVYADDYEYILRGNANDTYACDSMGQCYSCTQSVVSKTSDTKKAKENVNLP